MMEELLNIVEEAGEIMKDRTGLGIRTKGTRENLVTTADLKVEAFLREKLTELVEGSSFIGEESEHGQPGKTVWIVDPIDGTSNYARDLKMSTVSVALREGNETVAGVVYQPYTEEMYRAEAGKGSFLGNERLSVSSRPLSNSMFCTSWSAYKKEFAEMCFGVSRRLLPLCEDIRRFGTAAYELCLLAHGRIDIYYEANLQPWDHAAGGLILREAGGFCGSMNGKESFENEGPFIAANSEENFEILRRTVREEMAAFGMSPEYG